MTCYHGRIGNDSVTICIPRHFHSTRWSDFNRTNGERHAFNQNEQRYGGKTDATH